jgi:hypothetical protein
MKSFSFYIFVFRKREKVENLKIPTNSERAQQTSESSSNPLLFGKENKLSLSSPWSLNLSSKLNLNLAKIEKII